MATATTLNEGRDRSPGDRRAFDSRRRPGRSPGGSISYDRETASTLNEGRDRSPGDTHAQRRPGYGDHVLRRVRAAWRPLNEGRDRSPGDTCEQAKPVRGAQRVWSPLNEGRDRSPGDTVSLRAGMWGNGQVRSTKAGTVVPATLLGVLLGLARRRLRSTKAGTVVPATLDAEV